MSLATRLLGSNPGVQVSSALTGSLTTPGAKSAYVEQTAFQSISTVTVGAGGSSAITFSSIPSTYSHLQIRGIAHGSTAGDEDTYIQVGASSVETTNYAWHNIYGQGAGGVGGAAQSGSGGNYMIGAWNFAIGTGTANIFGAMIVDILDYSSSTKTKTIHSFAGVDKNGSGQIGSYSGFFYGANDVIGTIKIYPVSGSFSQYTHFALYGVKGTA